jgi:hypothetical protein
MTHWLGRSALMHLNSIEQGQGAHIRHLRYGVGGRREL